jgi:hypothetical protein
MRTGVKLAIEGLILLIVGLVVATFTYYLGKSKGANEQKTAFDQIPTQVNLNKTKWKVYYEDVAPADAQPTQPPRAKRGEPNNPGSEASPARLSVATLEFNQAGSRILGEGRDMTTRRWIVEGAAAERKVCYIYYDPEGQRFSMGTVLLTLDNDGKHMTGQWLGWGPGSNELHLRSVTLERLN